MMLEEKDPHLLYPDRHVHNTRTVGEDLREGESLEARKVHVRETCLANVQGKA